MTSAAESSDVFDISLFPSVHTEPVEALFTQAHDPVLVAGLCVIFRNRFVLMAGRTNFSFHATTYKKAFP